MRGRVEGGILKSGETVIVMPSGHEATIKAIQMEGSHEQHVFAAAGTQESRHITCFGSMLR